MNTLFCIDRTAWSKWLRANGSTVSGVWLIFEKGEARAQSLTYEEALDEALCYGWIDSVIKKLDETQYVRKFSQRRETSKWSPSNKVRVSRLMKEGRMRPAGTALVRKAKSNGMWNRPDRPPVETDVPPAFRKALRSSKEAKEYFQALAPSHQRRYVMWIASAKKQETIDRRATEALGMLKRKQTLGLK